MNKFFNNHSTLIIFGAILLLLGIIIDAIDLGDLLEDLLKAAGGILLIIGLIMLFKNKRNST